MSRVIIREPHAILSALCPVAVQRHLHTHVHRASGKGSRAEQLKGVVLRELGQLTNEFIANEPLRGSQPDQERRHSRETTEHTLQPTVDRLQEWGAAHP